MEIIGSINLLGISFDGVGTVADWVNIIATVITIIFTIRHFSKINKVKIRIRAHSEINDEGKKIIVFEVENLKQAPINVEFLGFKSKAIHNYDYAVGQQGMMYQNKLTGNIEQIRNKVDFLNKQAFDQFGYTEKIDGRDIGARIKLDIEDLNKAMEVNGINTNLYIRFKESTNSFKEKSVSQLIKNI
ncbi:hypothetical protein NGC69_00115 [Enterococcus lactis]|jgi:hypothetical protein|uniref:hypothetical protein n=1 Tax=Enterococcus TaxID=1350 RepID=UPI0019E21B75|nr:hypothetical protein [Enterococcus lactis]EGP4967131.1 hypothetical protein [Enterococcus faecium]EMF0443550.1 hypothetical protein [Enterococcus faecium]MEB7841799.1 hypothetical protein [Enterococcus lactis]MEB7853878.1 hypothetical protein [Enterococcus lactis]